MATQLMLPEQRSNVGSSSGGMGNGRQALVSGRVARTGCFAKRTVSTDAAVVDGMPMCMGGSMSVYMVIENFRNRDAVPVYRRFRDRGRLAPAGLSYVSSWVNEKLDRCYQVMEAEDRTLLDEWIANWSDIVDFEVYPVISSKEAADKIGPRL